MGSLLPAAPGQQSHSAAVAAKRSLQIMASFDVGCTVLGAARFGADLAVLSWGLASSRSSTSSDNKAVGRGSAAGVVLDASSTADELPVSSLAGGLPAPAAPDGSPAAGQPDAPGGQQQEQQLGLCFFTRAGQLLAADALAVSSPAAERRWHQLALLYPGDDDQQLTAAAAAATGRSGGAGGSLLASPGRSSMAGSAAASGRSTPVKPAALSPRDVVASSAGDEAEQQASSSPQATLEQQQEQEQERAQQQQRPSQQYKWWRDGEEPMYLISGPQVCACVVMVCGWGAVGWVGQRSGGLGKKEELGVLAVTACTATAAQS